MKRRILFVDDEPSFLDGMRRALRAERDRWEMCFVDSAEGALARLRDGCFDVVVSDVSMPGKDGFDLLVEMRSDERTRDTPLIMLTGREEADLKRRALDLGASDLLNKPVHPHDLTARVRSALRLKEYQDRIKAQSAILDAEVRERTAELAISRIDIILRLARAAEYRDEETGNHVLRVACYSRVIAESLGADAAFVERLVLASPLHDIGKIGIPDAILRRRGPLSDHEWSVMKRHCEIGAEILDEDSGAIEVLATWSGNGAEVPATDPSNPLLMLASSIALRHHEWWDGSGYPGGLSGEAIPQEARIVALADVYDALCSERPYKPAFREQEALAIMDEEAGRHFCPAAYAAFRRSAEDLRTIRTELADVNPRVAATGHTP